DSQPATNLRVLRRERLRSKRHTERQRPSLHGPATAIERSHVHVGRRQLSRSRRGEHWRDRARGYRRERIHVVCRHELDRRGQPDHHDPGLQRIPDISVLSACEPMTAILALLKDRRRSQRGSVLSGVLIMTAFIAIISGALMTELSTNFLLSHTLLNRAANEATDSSAADLSLSQRQ